MYQVPIVFRGIAFGKPPRDSVGRLHVRSIGRVHKDVSINRFSLKELGVIKIVEQNAHR
jgi:hypothetical protein